MFYNYFEKEKPGQGILHPIDENLKHDDKHFRVPTKKLSQKSVVLLLLIKWLFKVKLVEIVIL